jgi:hypothetical protein
VIDVATRQLFMACGGASFHAPLTLVGTEKSNLQLQSDFLTLSLIGRLDRLEYSVSHGEYLFFLKSLCDESVEMSVKWHVDKVQSHSL